MSKGFEFSRTSRTPQLLMTIVAVYTVLAALYFFLSAAGWLIIALALPTLPALWDLWRDTGSGLSITQGRVTWYSGAQHDSLALDQIDYVRFDTRWDFSVRVTFFLKDGAKRRLPPQVLPPHQTFETILQSCGHPPQRHHFRVL